LIATGSFNDVIYRTQIGGSRRSAEIIVRILFDLLQPGSVVDVGCGLGAWLAVFQAHGVSKVLGIDGAHVNRASLLIAEQNFTSGDLSDGFEVNEHFDLAISLEVAEHLPEQAARPFVKALTLASDIVLFSAAIPHQGGVHHVNEQWQSYWAELFQQYGYIPIDAIRPLVWNNSEVQWWYAQNSILYVAEGALAKSAALKEISKRTRHSPLDLVHPRKYLLDANPGNISVRRASRTLLAAVRRRMLKSMVRGTKG
jgi:cyclopropane fatty-acyl-phospholipid synthase-like methyltransferase